MISNLNTNYGQYRIDDESDERIDIDGIKNSKYLIKPQKDDKIYFYVEDEMKKNKKMNSLKTYAQFVEDKNKKD